MNIAALESLLARIYTSRLALLHRMSLYLIQTDL